MPDKKILIALVAVGALALVVLGWQIIAGSGSGSDAKQGTLVRGIGMPTGVILCDNGVRVPLEAAQPMVGPDGNPVPHVYNVPGQGTGYHLYRCIETGKEWPMGKDGQIYSPFATGGAN